MGKNDNYAYDIEKEAQMGDSEYQYLVGGLLIANKDVERGVYWLQRSAQQGNPNAINKLADMYYRGEDVPIDLLRAVYFFEISASQGNPTARHYAKKIYNKICK